MPAAFAPAAVIVLAAGEGTRMRSRTPKVLHRIAGRSLLHHAVSAAATLQPERLLVVVGHGRDAVAAALAAVAPAARAVVQAVQRGTGDAVACALAELPTDAGCVVVLAADVPLLRPETLHGLLAAHRGSAAGVTVLTTRVPDPTGYGRVVRDDSDQVVGIVEERDATAAQRTIDEINTAIYVFDLALLRELVAALRPDNAQGELYLTDTVAATVARQGRVVAVLAPDRVEVEGVNDRVQLARAGAALNARLLERWMRAGVTVADPATTWVDIDVRLAADVTLLPGTQLAGGTTVAADAVVGPDTTLSDCVVGAGARVVRTHADGAAIGAGAAVGPFAYLRPGTRIAAGAKVGTFVETKNADVGPGAKVPHLSYVGDASIGPRTNVGAGTIFANYDGVTKWRTTIGSDAFVGSNSVLVAPVRVGDGGFVAAGSALVSDVEPGALAIARGRQHDVPGWVSRRRPGTAAAEAAAAAAAGTASAGGAEPEPAADPASACGGGSVGPAGQVDQADRRAGA